MGGNEDNNMARLLFSSTIYPSIAECTIMQLAPLASPPQISAPGLNTLNIRRIIPYRKNRIISLPRFFLPPHSVHMIAGWFKNGLKML